MSEPATDSPALLREAFHCPFCGAYAAQSWSVLYFREGQRQQPTRVWRCQCFKCDRTSFWLSAADHPGAEDPAAPMLWPFDSSRVSTPHADMPPNVRDVYDEARGIVERSPRGAAALLRLGLQMLMVDLGEPGKNINADIRSLVSKGLAPEVQQALDAIRVMGNEAVHPGTLDLADDVETATTLFEVLNFIVDQRISPDRA